MNLFYFFSVFRNVHSRSAGRPAISLLKEQGRYLTLHVSIFSFSVLYFGPEQNSLMISLGDISSVICITLLPSLKPLGCVTYFHMLT